MGVKFLFITLAAQHAAGHGISTLLEDLKRAKEKGYMDLQRKEWDESHDIPTRSHHLFTGVPYHHHVGEQYDKKHFGAGVSENLGAERVV